MKCTSCGAEIADGESSCPACGSPIDYDTQVVKRAGEAGIEVGFSKVFDTPEFQAALKASNSANTKLWVALVVVFPILTAIAMALLGEGAVMVIGSALLVLVVAIIVVVFLLIKRNTQKPWDGVVEDLHRYRKERGADTYRIICRTDEGKRVNVDDRSNHPLYDYLAAGDRVRFHPRLNYPLEKFDKTGDTYLVCPFCGKTNPVEVEKCTRCDKPLLR